MWKLHGQVHRVQNRITTQRSFRYGVAALAVGVAVLLQHGLLSLAPVDAPYLTLYPALILTAILVGRGPGIFVAVVGAVLSEWLLIEPRGTWVLDLATALRLGVFLCAGVFLSWAGEQLRRSRQRAETEAETARAAAAALDRTEHLNRKINESTLNGIYIYDPALQRNVYINAEYARLTGWTKEQLQEVSGEAFLELFHPEDLPRVREHLDALISRARPGEVLEIEYRFRRADGKWSWCLSRDTVFDEEGAGGVRIIGTFVDVTSRKMALEAVRKSESEVRLIIDAVPSLISYIDSQYCYRLVNRTYERWFGTEAADILGRPVREVLGESTWERVRGYMERALAGEEVSYEQELPYREGGARWVHATYTPDRDDAGVVRGMVVLVNDITKNKKDEAALVAAREWLELANRAAEAGAWDWEIEQNRFFWSDDYCALYGLEPATCRPTFDAWLASVHPEDRERAKRAALEAVAGDGADLSLEFRIVRPGGEVRWMLSRGRIQRDPAGKAVRMVGVTRDITRQKQIEGDLRQANAAKDQFIAVLSHELRTPLTPALATAGALAVDDRLPEDAREDLVMIQKNIELETRLIDDLLEVTHIANGKLLLNPAPVDAAAVLRETMRMLGGELESRHLTMTLDMPGAPYWMLGDAARLHQVFWNLIRNAIKYSPQGGRIAVRCERAQKGGEDAWVSVQVIDNGAGIAPEFLPMLFTPFSQGRRVLDGAQGGLGLGLSIARALTEMHGGRIGARSDGEGKGATFTVDLPLSAVAEGEKRTAHDDGGASAKENGSVGRPLRILLVEDHADTARVMVRLLHREGHEVVCATSVRSGLETAKSGEFDVLISDLGLPDGTGYDLMREILATGKHLQGVVVSGFGTDEDIRRSHEAGFAEHIVKPFSFDAVQGALARVVGMASGA